MNGKTALIAGASGLIGTALLHLLLEGKEYSKVYAYVRSPLFIKHPKLTEVVVNFEQLKNRDDPFAFDDVYCCLGTTIKNAKTKEAMYRVDVDYPLDLAKLAVSKGAKQFLIVSSMNANPNSSIWYAKMKGKLEQELTRIPIESIKIFRPSLLLGNRKEFRLGERTAGIIFGGLSFLFLGPLKKYKPIYGETVALAMYREAQKINKGTTVYPSEQMDSLGTNHS